MVGYRRGSTVPNHPQQFDAGDSRDDDAPWSEAEDGDDHEVADQQRFSSNLAFCPECGAEIYDAADICPKCFSWINGETARRRPGRGLRRSLRHAILWAVIVAMILGAGVFGVLRAVI